MTSLVVSRTKEPRKRPKRHPAFTGIWILIAFLIAGSTAVAASPSCSDGLDNDGDGLIDWQLDLGCTDPEDDTEGGLNNALENGWTVFEPTTDTRIIYVSSSSGDDSYSGLAPEWDGVDGPKASAAAGISLMRAGMPDWLLFRRGDVWLNQSVGIPSGRSATEPSILGSYGDSSQRPRFELENTWLNIAGGTPEHIRILGAHVVMVGKAPDDPRFTGLGGNCIRWVAGGGDFLVEDVRCDYGQVNLEGNPNLPLTLRRSIFNGNYSLNSHAQALFSSIDAPLLIEENVFNHGGWNDVFRLALWSPEPNVAAWNQFENGHFQLTLDGSAHNITGVDLSGATTMAQVASLLESEINTVVGTDVVQFHFTDGGAFQLRSATLPSGLGYFISRVSDDADDLSDLFNIDAQGSPASTVFNRNMYLAHGFGNTIVRGNIDANGASGGLQLRMGGICEDNLFMQNPVSIILGFNQNDPNVFVGGAIRRNVILGARDIDTQAQASGIVLTSVANVEGGGGHSLIRDLEVSQNIIAHQRLGTESIFGLRVIGDGSYQNVSIHDNVVYDWAREDWASNNVLDQRGAGIRLWMPGDSDVEIFDNIINQPNGGFVLATENSADGVLLRDNQYWSAAPDPPDIWSRGWYWLNGSSVPGSDWDAATGELRRASEQVDFFEPSRSIDSYASSIDLDPTFSAFIGAAVEQSRLNWQPALTAASVNSYIRAGFSTNLFIDGFESQGASE